MPEIGRPAPDFELPNQDGKRVKLSDHKGKKVILFAFPKADTPGCNNQACGFRDGFDRIDQSQIVVLGISGDTPESLRRWKESRNLPYDLLSDPDHTVLKQWGARRQMPLLNIGLPLTVRSHWVIDEEGIVVDAQVGISPGNSVNEALKTVGL